MFTLAMEDCFWTTEFFLAQFVLSDLFVPLFKYSRESTYVLKDMLAYVFTRALRLET